MLLGTPEALCCWEHLHHGRRWGSPSQTQLGTRTCAPLLDFIAAEATGRRLPVLPARAMPQAAENVTGSQSLNLGLPLGVAVPPRPGPGLRAGAGTKPPAEATPGQFSLSHCHGARAGDPLGPPRPWRRPGPHRRGLPGCHCNRVLQAQWPHPLFTQAGTAPPPAARPAAVRSRSPPRDGLR